MEHMLTAGRHYDDLRNEQNREGSRMAREEHPMRRRTDRVERTFAPKKKPEVKGHEAFLKALEESGKEQGTQVEIEKKSTGEKVTGVVRCSDHFTITVRVTQPGGDAAFIDRVIFKHDISEFRALGGKKREERVDE